MYNIFKSLSRVSGAALFLLLGCGFLHGQEFRTKSWTILQAGSEERSDGNRAQAISALGIIPDNPQAVLLGERALQDSKSEVRRAAVVALGEMSSTGSLPKIKALLEDSDTKTVLAVAAVLTKFNDPAGYKIYCEIISGQRKGSSLLDDVKDKKNLEKMGIEGALGFVPYAGYGVSAYNYFKRNDQAKANLNAKAATALAQDPDPSGENALINASLSGKEVVQLAALRALAERGNPAVIKDIVPALYCKKTRVRYTAAAALVHLSDQQSKLPQMITTAQR